MGFRRSRLIQPEILDHQTPERAAPSLADIVRINRLLGGHAVLRGRLREIVAPGESFTMLDVGAGSGDAASVVLKEYPTASVFSLDYREHHVRSARGERMVADAFRFPLRPASFDIVYAGLFLHHFKDEEVVRLLDGMKEIARRFVVINDLERHFLPYHFLPATRWMFGWDPITLHDGAASVQASFTAAEMRRLAERAGLREIDVRVHRPAFRVSMAAKIPGDKLRV
jgi:2-polyprenyl-3-methyl-5-hydroxy-6-metoxy-1,4-benzoquinol methylase